MNLNAIGTTTQFAYVPIALQYSYALLSPYAYIWSHFATAPEQAFIPRVRSAFGNSRTNRTTGDLLAALYNSICGATNRARSFFFPRSAPSVGSVAFHRAELALSVPLRCVERSATLLTRFYYTIARARTRQSFHPFIPCLAWLSGGAARIRTISFAKATKSGIAGFAISDMPSHCGTPLLMASISIIPQDEGYFNLASERIATAYAPLRMMVSL